MLYFILSTLGVILIAYIGLVIYTNRSLKKPVHYVPYIFSMEDYYSFKRASYLHEPIMATICKDERNSLIFAINYMSMGRYQVGEIEDLKYKNHSGGELLDELEFLWNGVNSEGILKKSSVNLYRVRGEEGRKIKFRCLINYLKKDTIDEGYVGIQVYPKEASSTTNHQHIT